MSYRSEEITKYKTIVKCDDCGREREISTTPTPLGFDNRMNGALQNRYSFTQEGGVFKNYCSRCQEIRREAKES
ncbi:hypothetical protein [Paenibacillus wynnii]|uniref:Uncharacterized protein n=1 Tax=Paenibacillus wynnii TaxID=268407 RepID=A0A098MF19_9BACL|nr:hypothetical protein [Paenibacillus wynnii]KGE18446.1 hypothetical protein PWYN_28530 [Paenibacillus wynnii]KGE20656.1 hypothetical protein PWYN_00155 [Paenibacillus wynnii]